MVCAAAAVYVPPENVVVPLPSSATYSVSGFANHRPNGNTFVVVLASVVLNPLRMHMLLGSPAVCRFPGSKASGELGSGAPAAGRPVPFGHALPVVSRKYSVLTPLLPLPLV